STLSAPKIWFDDTVGPLNKDGNGILLGRFEENDRVIAFYKDGTYELTDFELSNRYDIDNIVLIEKFKPAEVVSAIYFDAKANQYNAKRFVIESQTLKNKYLFVKEGEGNRLELVTTQPEPIVLLKTGKKKSELEEEEIALSETIDITGWKTIGTRIAGSDLKEISLVSEEGETASENEAPTLF